MDMDKVVRRKQLLEMIGVSAATQHCMGKAGLFPSRFRLGRGLVGWHLFGRLTSPWVPDQSLGSCQLRS